MQEYSSIIYLRKRKVNFVRMIIRLIYLLIKKTNNLLYRLFVNPIKVKLLKSSGKKVYISRKCDITYKNVIMGNNVYVGPGCYLLSPKKQNIYW